MGGLGAVVLAGGRSRRLDGIDKALLEVLDDGEARTLVARACDQVAAARTVVVVGPVDPTELPAHVRIAREDPPFGGPAAALGAGLAALGDDRPEWVVVLACDLPDVGPAVEVILAAVAAGPETDAVVTVDGSGRLQWLTAAYRTEALDAAVLAAGDLDGLGVGRVVGGLAREEIVVPGAALLDVDTWDAVRQRGSIRQRPEQTGADHG